MTEAKRQVRCCGAPCRPAKPSALTGTLPLSVVVGRAVGVDVQVRGKPFDLAPLTRADNVARFEVKP